MVPKEVARITAMMAIRRNIVDVDSLVSELRMDGSQQTSRGPYCALDDFFTCGLAVRSNCHSLALVIASQEQFQIDHAGGTEAKRNRIHANCKAELCPRFTVTIIVLKLSSLVHVPKCTAHNRAPPQVK